MVITLVCGLVYGAVQQNFRQSANDPQIQIAEDVADALSNGRNPQDLNPVNKVEIAKSLASYLIIFNDLGEPIASSAQLDGEIPQVPAGVFDYVRRFGEDRFTWQPRSDARSAVVVTRYQGNNSGFVLAGRSMREVERREDRLLMEVAFAWMVNIFASFVAAAVVAMIPSGRKSK